MFYFAGWLNFDSFCVCFNSKPKVEHLEDEFWSDDDDDEAGDSQDVNGGMDQQSLSYKASTPTTGSFFAWGRSE